MFTVEVKRRTLRRLKELDEKRRERVREIITLLKGIPYPSGKLT